MKSFLFVEAKAPLHLIGLIDKFIKKFPNSKGYVNFLENCQRLGRDLLETCQKLVRVLLETCQILVRDLLETG